MSWLFRFHKFILILFVPLWRSALMRLRVAAAAEHAIVLDNLEGIRTVVDIGANRGQFALVARRSFPDARIVSFEPLTEPASVYKFLFKNDPSTKLVQAAVGPSVGEATIHVSARDDSSSLLPITARQNSIFPGTAQASVTKIQVIRLSDAMEEQEVLAPALLKLDVQGYELQALIGCSVLLDKFSWVYVECSFMELYADQALADAVIAWLRVHNFILSGVYNMTYDRRGRAVQADFLFSNTALVDRNSVI